MLVKLLANQHISKSANFTFATGGENKKDIYLHPLPREAILVGWPSG
jgi:hypothetical protein